MRKPHISAKRVLGLTLATALAVTGTVALATTSEAVTTPTASLTPATGDAAGGTVITIKGKGFQDSTGATTALSADFGATNSCGTTVTTAHAPTTFNVQSATKIVATSPALAAGTWYLCIWDKASGTATALGLGKFVTGAAPTATTIGGSAATVASASALGGTSIAVDGTNFDKTVKASIDGVAAKATYVSAAKVSVVLPAHAAGTGYKVKVSTQFGSASTSTDTVSFLPVVSVSPASGTGADNSVLTVTGTGFSNMTFDATSSLGASKTSVVLVPAGSVIADTTDLSAAFATALPGAHKCDNVTVESDTSLSCQINTAATGAYSVVLLTLTSGKLVVGASSTGYSKLATYTAASF